MNVSLTPELVEFVQARVQSGRYQTASEVVREALRGLEEREMERLTTLAAVRENLDSVYRASMDGELLDADAAFGELRRRFTTKRESRPATEDDSGRTPDVRGDHVGSPLRR